MQRLGLGVWSGRGRLGDNGPGLLNVDTLVVSASVMMARVTRPQPRPLTLGWSQGELRSVEWRVEHTRARAPTHEQ